MRGWRRWVCLMLLICLLPLWAGAQAIPTDEAGKPLNVSGQCLYQDRLLLWTGKTLYQWTQTEGARVLGQAPEGTAFTHLVAEDDRLYGYDMMSRLLYPLRLDEGGLYAGQPLSLIADLFDDPQNEDLSPDALVLVGQRLYALYRPGYLGGWQGLIYAFDMHSGQGRSLDIPFPQALCRGPGDTLWLMSHDHRSASDTLDKSDDMPGLLRLDTHSGELSDWGRFKQPFDNMDLPEMPYDEQTGDLYYAMSGRLWRRDRDGQEHIAALLPQLDGMSGAGKPLLLLHDGSLSLISRGQAQLMSPEAQQSMLASAPLTLYGVSDISQHEKIMQSLPDLAIQRMDQHWEGPGQLGQQLAGGASDIDVL